MGSNKKNDCSIWTRGFIFINICSAFSWLSINMVNATIAPYAVSLGASSGVAGILSGFYYLSSFSIRPFSGALGSRLNRRLLLLWTSVLWAVLDLLMALMPANVVVVLILRALQGIGYSVATTVSMTIAADLLPQSRVGEGIGYFGLCQVFAQLVGPSVALSLAAYMGYRPMFFISFASRVFSTVMILALPSYKPVYTEKPGQKRRLSVNDIIARESLLPATVGMLFSILNGSLIAFLALYADSLGIGSAGGFFIINAIFMFITRMLSSRSADGKSLAAAAVSSGSLLIFSMLLLGVGRSREFMLLSGIVFGVGYGLLLPVTQSRSVQAPPLERRNIGSNTYYIGIDIGFTLGNFFAGHLAGAVGYSNMFLFLIFPAAAAIGLALWKGRVPGETKRLMDKGQY